MPPDGSSLGRRLEAAREEAGYTLRKLAEVTGVPMSSINRLLKDEVAEPSPTYLVELAKVLDLNPSELFALAGLPYPDLDDVLRNVYGLPDEIITEIHSLIADHARER
jgi:transcriptional regulator with XRE-family HTH domain